MKKENLALYKIWAPEDMAWAAWAKPVLFAGMSVAKNQNVVLVMPSSPLRFDQNTMVVVDLPSVQGVEEALGFAEKGWRPVPLYNGVMGVGTAIINVRPLAQALFFGANTLRGLSLRKDAPPVFMLDANRMNGTRKPGAFDNRWCVFPQDMPSAQYLKSQGIEKLVLRAERLQTDLSRVLYDYQKDGISLYLLKAGEACPQKLSAKKQSASDEWAYRLKVTLRLKRNAAGGFGGAIPAPYEQSGSGRYYGVG